MTVRMIFLSAHYRAPINFEPGLFDEAKARLERIYNALEALDRVLTGAAPAKQAGKSLARDTFEVAMNDDFNTAGALATVFDLISDANKDLAGGKPDLAKLAQSRADMLTMLNVLGIRPVREVKGGEDSGDSLKLVELLLQVRQDVRAAKLYAVSDKIRNGLKEIGYEVEDLPGGKWTVKRR
jgi:cysteinyl-tRNA synthetase